MAIELSVGSVYRSTVATQVVDKADVVLAGGGTAGCIAAIAAARNGADVLLIEEQGFLGGMMTAGNAGLTKYIVHDKDQTKYRNVVASNYTWITQIFRIWLLNACGVAITDQTAVLCQGGGAWSTWGNLNA